LIIALAGFRRKQFLKYAMLEGKVETQEEVKEAKGVKFA
jgi:hypothetical protein